MYLRRASDLRDYIISKYQLIPEKVDVLKIGQRMYLILVTPSHTLFKAKIYVGILESANTIAVMKKVLDTNIENALIKVGYIKKQDGNGEA
ncbi:MAG: hypothetical protein WC979_00975 [Candidatus Pacearchaeota archaeon]|jgi:hypothetical protein